MPARPTGGPALTPSMRRAIEEAAYHGAFGIAAQVDCGYVVGVEIAQAGRVRWALYRRGLLNFDGTITQAGIIAANGAETPTDQRAIRDALAWADMRAWVASDNSAPVRP